MTEVRKTPEPQGRFTDDPDPTWTHYLAIHYNLEDDTIWTLNIPDYTSLMDPAYYGYAEQIMEQDVFRPDGLRLVSIKGIEKIDKRTTPIFPE